MSRPRPDLEFYETPHAFTRYLFRAMALRGTPITGTVFQPCVGSGAIIEAQQAMHDVPPVGRWITNDLDTHWPADYHEDAARPALWERVPLVDWTVDNPPFTPALEIIEHALTHSRVGVAMHLRASIHEVLKSGPRRTWMNKHCPTGLLWLPRFGYQRSKKKGKWSTDSVCACWVVWLNSASAPQFIDYAPVRTLDELKVETPSYRARMDRLMGVA